MSGGVGPTCSDISLPKEQHEDFSSLKKKGQNIAPSKKAGFLSFTQLNALAVITILAASGMVSPEDFAFVVFSIIYMFFISKVAFPCVNPSKDSASVFDPKNKILRLYVSVAAIIGLFLPIAYIFEGIFEGDKEGIKAAAPHLFLLASQVFMEGVAFSLRFAIPVRVFVPVFYNSRRIFTIVEWLTSEFKVEQDHGGSARRVLVGRALAVANMAFWCFNLFGFLLPVYLPKAFKKYYSAYDVKD
ncbi:hypothetical protein P3X46_023801 [Hevea brasiliensis]|uniref:DUF7733 domain-containing protein n=1 Tax=Hevea brasiliensis TaxID=3981 RepID=A0ABQ9LC26_HEVBR|nr:uncharacterized protein LOC110662196 [Hevea brasiliensis]KAJ9164198.1 hypothetical protein P3X46_023801 [Hevea brasiliensis]